MKISKFAFVVVMAAVTVALNACSNDGNGGGEGSASGNITEPTVTKIYIQQIAPKHRDIW